MLPTDAGIFLAPGGHPQGQTCFLVLPTYLDTPKTFRTINTRIIKLLTNHYRGMGRPVYIFSLYISLTLKKHFNN